MKNRPSVAIIIINWNGADDTIECLESLNKIDYPNYKIFLIDNGSSDDSVLRLRAVSAPNLEIIETGKNLGFSGGNNVGIKKALTENFDYVLLLNNDTTVDPNFLDELVKIAESGKDIGIVGPKIYFFNEPNRIWYGGGKFSWLGGGRHLQYEEIDPVAEQARYGAGKNPDENKPRETDYMTGCAFLIKSEVIKKIGMLDERFFMYYEDTDWSLSAKKSGYKIIYAPSAKIYHKISKTAAKLGNPTIHYYHIRNALLLSKKQAPLIILAGIYAWSIMNYAKQILKSVILPSKLDISKMIMRGIKDFWKGKFGQYQSNNKSKYQ